MKNLFWTLLLLITSFPLQAKHLEDVEKLINIVAESHLKSFPVEKRRERASLKKNVWDIDAPSITEKEMREIVYFNMMEISEKFRDQPLEHILHPNAYNDLKIFFYNMSNPNAHLLSKFNQNLSPLGETSLAWILGTPTTNIMEIARRQEIIGRLASKKDFLDTLSGLYAKMKDKQKSVLSLFSTYDPLYDRNFQALLNEYYYSRVFPSLNRSQKGLEIAKRYFVDGSLFLNSLTPLSASAVVYNTMSKPNYRLPVLGSKVSTWQTILASGIALFALGSYNSYIARRTYYSSAAPLFAIRTRIRDVSLWINDLEEIEKWISSREQLAHILEPELASIRIFLSKEKLSVNGKMLFDNLRSNTFKSEKANLFTYQFGKVLRTFDLFKECKDEFVDAMLSYGRIEAFMSVAKVYQDVNSNNNEAYFSFANIKDHNETNHPSIELEKFWNPFLDPKKSVTNDINIGEEFDARNLIVSGPNAGGKSTLLSGIAINILLAQTLGISSSQRMEITPFTKISTYMNITDDIESGKSLFMAEVDRAHNHIKTISQLHSHEFSFTIMDELFSGTNPVEGEAAAYSIAKFMGNNPRSLSVFATHFPRLTLLEKNTQEKSFANFKVTVHKENGKPLRYPYKILPGISHQAIALDILENQGFDMKMLEDARKIITNPEEFKTSQN